MARTLREAERELRELERESRSELDGFSEQSYSRFADGGRYRSPAKAVDPEQAAAVRAMLGL